MAIATTIRCTGRSRRKTGHGFPSAPPRIRFPAGSTPDTISRRLHPGYGFPPAPPQIRFPAGSTPDTAAPLISPRTAHAPLWGRGRSAAGAGGVGDAGRSAWVSLPKARAGWGCRGSVWVSLRRRRRGGCRQKRMGIFLQRRGWGGGGRRSVRVSPAGEMHGYPPAEGAGGGGRRRAHRYSPLRDAGRERCPERQRIGLQSLSLSAASISTRLPSQPAWDRR